MALTVANIQSLTNQYIRDASVNSVTAADRLAAITEAVKQLFNDFGFDVQNHTHALSYFDTVNYYDITTVVPDFMEPTDLRKVQGDQTEAFTRKTPRDIAVEIDTGFTEQSFSIDRHDLRTWLVVNNQAKYPAVILEGCNSLTENGSWTVDATNSDAINITLDEVEFKTSPGSFNFDVDVSQSGNNKATIVNSTFTSTDLSTDEDISDFVFWIYIPDVTFFTGMTGYWGSSASNYWTASATTDVTGNAWANGWNRVGIAWNGASVVGTPDSSAIAYFKFDFNYSAGQGDDTDYRIDDIKIVRPEVLTLFYEGWAVGQTSTSVTTKIYAFTATTNVPFFSGQYDFFDIYTAHLAAAILFRQMGLPVDAQNEEGLAARELARLRKRFPSSHLTETTSFKAKGLNFKKRKI